MISPRTRLLFLLALFFALTVVLGIFGLVIAVIFKVYPESVLAVWVSLLIAMLKGPLGIGSGGLLLWPLFGATNQLLAGLAFMVIAFYLWRRNKPVGFVLLPMIFMIVLPGWALVWQLFNNETGWWQSEGKLLVAIIGSITLALQVWMVIEALLMCPQAKGVIETDLPPLKPSTELESSGGRSC